MRYVRFHPNHLNAEGLSDAEKEEFRLWLKDAEAATRKAVEEYEMNETPSEETEAIWRAHKKWLLRNKFNNKCAYCEKNLADIPKDAEHWRPKRKITGPKAGAHPGYFWLAYSWRNLLPACSMCNSYEGKKNQFPVSNDYVFRRRLTDAELEQLICRSEAIPSSTEAGAWYLGAEDLDVLEHPLLLHPYVDEDPTVHLEFRPNGFVRPRTKKGEWSIKVFDLNREDLRTERTRAEQATDTMVGQVIEWAMRGGRSPQESLDEAETIVRRYTDERAPYSAAMMTALARAVERRRQLLDG
jgi:hypothetical protein